jgi:hypothetical protein
MPVGGLLLAPPRASEAQAPTATPSTTTTPGPAPADGKGDRSPKVHGDKAGADAAGAPGPAAAETALPPELGLSDLFPSPTTTDTAAAPDAPAPTGPAPAGEAVADYGHGPRSHWPLVAGMLMSLAVLVFGGAFVWWRNRDTRYWPA